MVNIGKLSGRKTISVITNMDVPLGINIGNSLEVIESIEVLRGNGPKDLTDISICLASCMVMLCKNISKEEAEKQVREVISNGKALDKLKSVVKAQGGNVDWIENTDNFPKAKYEIKIKSPKTGFIKYMNTEEIGKISCILGAGREKKDDMLDYSAGISIYKKTSDFVNARRCFSLYVY